MIGFNYSAYITLPKFINALKNGLSFYVSKWTHSPWMWGMPVGLSIEPTTACNLRCPECPSGLRSFTRATGNLQKNNFEKFMDEIQNTTLHLTFYFQGEPYINKDFLNMVASAHQRKIYTITSTNAHFLDDETAKKTVLSGLDTLIISIDGITQDVYEQYRVDGHVDKVLEGTKNILHWKKILKQKNPQVVWQYLVVKPNEHQLDDAKKLAKEIGVDELVFKTAQIYDYKHGHELIPDNSRYSRYQKKNDGTYKIKNELANQCWKMWNSLVVTWDGKAVPCCFDKDAKYNMGNVFQESLSKIWKNKAYHSFRSSLLKGRKNIDICTNCSEGTKVWEV